MPAYIKFYYACAIYFLLWASGLGIWFVYNIMHYGIRNSQAVVATALTLLILAITIAKGSVSIKAWQCYRQFAQLTKAARRLFVTMYYCTLLLSLGMLLLDVLVIPDDIKRNYANGFILNPADVLLDGSIILLTIACAYFAIADWMLFKAIQKRQEENLLSFEVD